MKIEKRYLRKKMHIPSDSPPGNFREIGIWPTIGEKVWYGNRLVEVFGFIKREMAVKIIDPEDKFEGGRCAVGLNWICPQSKRTAL